MNQGARHGGNLLGINSGQFATGWVFSALRIRKKREILMSGGNEKGAEEVAPFGEEGDNGKN